MKCRTGHYALMVVHIDRVEPVLHARDVAGAIEFYARLGFEERFRDDEHAPRFALVRRDGVVIAIQWHDFEGMGDRPTLRFFVPDVDALSVEFGSAFDRTEIGDTPWGTREFHLRDPSGNGLQFYRDL